MEGIAQDLFLLCLNERNGSLRSSVAYYGFAGAMMMQLAEKQRISLDGKKVQVLDSSSTGNSLLDEMLEKMSKAKKPKSLENWVATLASSIKNLPSKVAEPLVHDGILSEEVKKILGLFPSQRFYLRDPGRHSEVVERVRAILLQMRSPDQESIALIAMAKPMELLDRLFTREERKMIKPYLKQLTSEQMMGKVVSGSIAAMQAAIMAAVSAATMITITSSTTSS